MLEVVDCDGLVTRSHIIYFIKACLIVVNRVSKLHADMHSTVLSVSSISLSEGSGGSSLAKLETYDVNAENNPPSDARSARSTT